MNAATLTHAERDLILEACLEVESEHHPRLTHAANDPSLIASAIDQAREDWEPIVAAIGHLGLPGLANALAALLTAVQSNDAGLSTFLALPDVLRQQLPPDECSEALIGLLEGHGVSPTTIDQIEQVCLIKQRQSTDPAAVALVQSDWDARPVISLDPAMTRALETELPVLLLRLQRALHQAQVEGQWDEVQRVAHTLKGSANTAELKVIAVVAHLLEDWVETQAAGTHSVPTEHWDWGRFWDALREAVQSCLAGRSAQGALVPWYARLHEAVLGESPADLPPESSAEPLAAPSIAYAPSSTRGAGPMALGEGLDSLVSRQAAVAQHVAAATLHLEGLQGFQRLSHAFAERLDSLSSEFQRRLDQLQATAALGPSGDAELSHLARRMAELTQDHAQAQKSLDRDLAAVREAVSGLGSEQQLAQDALWSLQAVPLASVEARLQRIVAQVAQSTGKQARLVFEPGSARVVQESLDSLMEVLGHLLRNAVDHGIETPAERQAAGKPEEGSVWVTAQAHDGQITVSVSDDGRGIDLDAVKRRASAMGWTFDTTSDQWHQVIFEPGFSTRDQASLWSGRGVGLDVVRALSRAQGGEVHVRPPNRFELTWPTPGQLVAVVPVAWESTTLFLLASDLVAIEPGQADLDVTAQLPCSASTLPGAMSAWRLTLASGASIRVWGLGDAQRVPLHSMAPWAVEPMGLVGMGLDRSGEARAILDPSQWLALGATALALPGSGPGHPQPGALTAQAKGDERPLVLVVDDAVVVREHTARFLTSCGWRVMQACDGVEALDLVEEHRPDLLVTDLEMPRSTGLDLAHGLRAQPRFAALPIILITSRSGAATLDKAMEAGIDRVLMKPFVERELLQAIAQLAPLPTQAAIG
jgi:chemosensory pili system protein ChpA (sensor histidine kinase/response regulator)